PDGVNAVANFDVGKPGEDGLPEIVLVAEGKIWMLEHDGTTRWGPITIPGGCSGSLCTTFWGGAPTVADLDGDGKLEIAVSALARFVVFDALGNVKWSAPTQDSTNSGGSVAFDFDGDGAAEIVVQDESFLRIYNGRDGVVIYQTPLDGGTASVSPV